MVEPVALVALAGVTSIVYIPTLLLTDLMATVS